MPPGNDVGMIPEAATLPVAKVPGPGSARPTHVRYIVLGLTIAAYMITYIDRVVISSAVPSIQKEFGFSIVTMGWILSSFQWAYAIFQIPGGWLGDRIGPRRALTLIVTWWSLFTCATVLAWSAGSMALIRFLFGMGEAGAFPIATRSLSRWMLPTERGLAQGATHAGSRLGGALTPALVVLIIAHYGWRTAFVCCGSLGLIWAAVWYWYYRNTPDEHKSVNSGEREQIRSALELARGSKSTQSVPWKRILRSRQMWILSAMYFCYAYNLSVYLVWFPKYLNDHRGFNLQRMGFYASLLLLAGTVGRHLWRLRLRFLGKEVSRSQESSPPGGSGRFLSICCGDGTCLPYERFDDLCVALLCGDLCVGIDGGCVLGHHPRHWRRFRGFGLLSHEYLRQPWRCDRVRIVGLSCRDVWVERAVPANGWPFCCGHGVVFAD
jgi:MFS family permease